MIARRNWEQLQAVAWAGAQRESRHELDHALYMTGAMVGHLVELADELATASNLQERRLDAMQAALTALK